jgi:hypothetical protein
VRILPNGRATRRSRGNDRLRPVGSRHSSAIKNPETGKTIDLPTFRRCFKAEIATGAAKLKSQVGQLIVATILGEPGGIPDSRAGTLTVLFAKDRLGWTETVADKHAKKDGRPFILKVSKGDASL